MGIGKQMLIEDRGDCWSRVLKPVADFFFFVCIKSCLLEY